MHENLVRSEGESQMVTDAFACPKRAAKFAQNVDAAIENKWYTRGRLFLELAERLIPKGAHILDYGCGPGRLGLMLAREGYRVRGVDPSAEMIKQAESLNCEGVDIDFRVGGTEVLAPGSYDAIVCSAVIDYVPEPHRLLRCFHRSLKPSGVLLISHGNASSLWNWYAEVNPRVYNPFLGAVHQRFTARGLKKTLRKNGFITVTRPQYFEPSFEHWFGPLLLRVPFVGALSIVGARRRDDARVA